MLKTLKTYFDSKAANFLNNKHTFIVYDKDMSAKIPKRTKSMGLAIIIVVCQIN